MEWAAVWSSTSMECTGDSGQVRVHVHVRARTSTNVRVFEQNLLTRAVESTRGHLDELSVQYVLRVLYILALRAPSRVLFSFHSTRPHPFFFFLPIFSFTQAEWCNHTAYTKRVWRTPCNLLLPKKKQTNLIKSKEIGWLLQRGCWCTYLCFNNMDLPLETVINESGLGGRLFSWAQRNGFRSHACTAVRLK